jgi:triosephosphate isomerase
MSEGSSGLRYMSGLQNICFAMEPVWRLGYGVENETKTLPLIIQTCRESRLLV